MLNKIFLSRNVYTLKGNSLINVLEYLKKKHN